MTGTVHVEVRLRSGPYVPTSKVQDEVLQYISDNCVCLDVGKKITAYEPLQYSPDIEFIKVDGYSGLDDGKPSYLLKEVQLDVQAYHLNNNEDDGDELIGDKTDDDDALQQLRLTILPSVLFDGLWETLVYPQAFHKDLLRFASRMLTITRAHVLDSNYFSWNGLFLLHGPPGSGKTTLCRALAQKLRIRLGNIYQSAVLLELNPPALFSKYFGESGRIVDQVFERVQSFADSSSDTLICLMIDEVETLVAPRELSAFGGEVADAMRVTNGILTALDRLRRRPNVMVLCTSNMIDAIDSAFLDRVDMIQYVPNPEPDAVYSILRSSLNVLITQKCIESTAVCAPGCPSSILGMEPSNSAVEASSATPASDTRRDSSMDSADDACRDDWKEVDDCSTEMEDPTLFPSLEYVQMQCARSSVAMKLWHFSKKCIGMSGRSLRRLPSKAIGLYTYSDRPSISEVLEALDNMVEIERLGKELMQAL